MLLETLCRKMEDSNTYRSKPEKKQALDPKQSFSCTVEKEIVLCTGKLCDSK